jgi:hypothetical protein
LTEAILVTSGFVLAVLLSSGTAVDAKIYLLYENGAGRIGLVVLVFLVLMYYFDLYNSSILTNRREVVTRLVGVLGTTFVALAVLYYTFPDARLGGAVVWGRHPHGRNSRPGVAKFFFRTQSIGTFC